MISTDIYVWNFIQIINFIKELSAPRGIEPHTPVWKPSMLSTELRELDIFEDKDFDKILIVYVIKHSALEPT